MLLGNITGKVTTKEFQFLVKNDARKFEYIQLMHKDGYYVLGQIIELEKDSEKEIASCNVIGYRENGNLKVLSTPLDPGSEVLRAEDEFIKETLGLEKEKGVYIGKLNGKDIKAYLDVNRILTKHIAVLAKSGSGKCVYYNSLLTFNNGDRLEIGSLVDSMLKKHFKKEGDIEFIENKNFKLKIVSIDDNNQVNSSKITKFMRRKSPEDIYFLETQSGQTIKLTDEHPVPVFNDGAIRWIPVSDLKERDYVLLPKLNIRGSEQVIDLIDIWRDSNKVRVDDKKILNSIYQEIKIKRLSFSFLSKKLGFSISALRKWFKISGIPLKQLIKISESLGMDFFKLKKEIKFLRYSQGSILPTHIKVSEDFSKLMGYMLAEGHNNYKTINFINFSKEIQKDYIKLVKKVFNLDASPIGRENIFMIYNTFLAKTLKKLGFTNASFTKYIPPQIIKSQEGVICAFLSSFIDCDGHIGKKSASLELCLASKDLTEDLSFIFLRLGIVSRSRDKIVNGVSYSRLMVYGSKSFEILNSRLSFLIPHKASRLSDFSKADSNPNVDVIPGLKLILRKLIYLLRMNYSMFRTSVIGNCLNREDSPSFDSLRLLVDSFKNRMTFLQDTALEIETLFSSMFSIDENKALELLCDVYENGMSFTEMAKGTKISPTTVRRMVRGVTAPTNNVYYVLSNILDKENKNLTYQTDPKELAKLRDQIYVLCNNIGYEKQKLCNDVGRHKQFLYGHCLNGTIPLYSSLYQLSGRLFEFSKVVKRDIEEAEQIVKYLDSILNSNLFFDPISFIKKIKSDYKYVYDLETEHHNFVANNLVVHNSYTVGVLLEEFLDRKIPILVIDPHGEYSSLKFPNLEEKERLMEYGLESKHYKESVKEFSINIKENPSAVPLKLNNRNLSSSELIHLLPARLSNAQLGVLYSALKDVGDRIDFNALLLALEQEDSSVKWTLLNIIEYVKNLNLFSDLPTGLDELIKPGQASIINLKGVNTEVQEVVVYKLVKDLFEARKTGKVSPFLLVLEEAHNYIPERGYGEAKSSNILRQVFAEGRKFGLGCCLITQRPSRVEKNALSQITTQIILKVTNPNDIKAISNSVEGITLETEKEIQNLPIGTALVTGVVDRPLFVDIRPRKSKHGGDAVKIFDEDVKEEINVVKQVEDFKEGELLPLIKQKVSLKDLKLMYGKINIKTFLIPCLYLRVKYGNEEINLVVNLNSGELIDNIENGKGARIDINSISLSSRERKFLGYALLLKEFRAAELFSKSGMQFSEVYDMINLLTNKGVFVKVGESYRVSDRFSFITNIEKYRVYEGIDYSNFNYDEKLSANFNREKIKEILGDFLDIKEMQECNLVVYGN